MNTLNIWSSHIFRRNIVQQMIVYLFFKNTGEEYVHVLTQATVLEENQKTYM